MYEFTGGNPHKAQSGEFETHKLSSKQRKLFGELQEAQTKLLATARMLEKAKIEAEFAFATFWGAVNKAHKLYGKHAVIDPESLELRISK